MRRVMLEKGFLEDTPQRRVHETNERVQSGATKAIRQSEGGADEPASIPL